LFQHKIEADQQSNSISFGHSSGLFNNKVFIGASADYERGTNSGSVFIYDLNNFPIFKNSFESE
jgi:hypothetical protein